MKNGQRHIDAALARLDRMLDPDEPAMTNLKVIRAGRLIDGTGAAVQHDRAMYVEDGRIVGIEPAGDPPADAEVIDLADSSVLPGLIDGHVHLVFSAGTYPLGDLEVEDDQRLLLRAVAAARQALGAGITTVRDLGGRGGVTFRVRDGITAGLIAGPRILAAGSPITITGGTAIFWVSKPTTRPVSAPPPEASSSRARRA